MGLLIEGISPMRDLTADLKERLSLIEGKLGKARVEVRELENEQNLIRGLLEIEMRRAGRVAGEGPVARKPISEIINELFLKHGAVSKDTMRQTAEAAGHHAPARSIHANLMNLTRHGYVMQTAPDTYRLTEKARNALVHEGQERFAMS